MTYLCVSPHCSYTGPVCSNKDCFSQHCHKLQVMVTPIKKLIQQLINRKESNKQKIQQLRVRIGKYLESTQLKLQQLIEDQEKKIVICQKVFLQLNDLTPDMVLGIQLAKQGRWGQIDKKALNKIFNLLNSQVNKQKRQLQVKQLEKEIEKRVQSYKQYTAQLKEAKQIQKIFNIKVYNTRKNIQYSRFDAQSTSWSFGKDKIDAIQFTVKQPQRLIGYVHFGITDWSNGAQMRIKCTLYCNDKEIYKQQLKIVKQIHQSKNTELFFNSPIDLAQGQKYDLVQQNTGPNFQGKQGNSSKQEVGPFKFYKSSKDNNGTSNTAGQYKALIVQANI